MAVKDDPVIAVAAEAIGAVVAAIVTDVVVLLQLVVVFKKVKVALPVATPVTTPELVTVAIELLLLVHVPPIVGDNVIVLPTQTEAPALTTGSALMDTALVVALQVVEVVSVKIKVALPAATPVTTPELVTVAIELLLLVHVPPIVGDNVIVLPTQTEAPAVTTGCALMVTAVVVALQLVVASVKVKVALPPATPVTTPVLVTVAFVVSLLDHVPPVVGDNVIVLPTQTEAAPVLTTGKALMVTEVVVALQVVAASVKVKVALPPATPVTTPALVTVAFVVSLLDHVPPVVGDNVI